jgi:phosphoserine aminotransferase
MARADAMRRRSSTSVQTRNDWIDNLAADPATRSNTSVCLKFTDPRIADGAAFAKAVAKRLEAEGVALDVGAYRDAPPGLRIWCGGTVETADIEAMLPWLDWAFQTEIAAQAEAA